MSLSDYHRIKTIGSGGFGDAFLVELRSDKKKQFVLKQMTFSSDEEHQDCVAEVEMLRHLSHTHIVAFRESFINGNVIYLVMEYCKGGDMAGLIKKQLSKSYFLEVEIINWTLQILEALQYLHGRSKPILHRDMKPANIFLTADFKIKIGDFGISRELARFGDLATTICGTPLYLSPEVFRQLPYDHKCDIWSLGCCVYEMMTFKTAINPLLLAVLNIPSVNPMPTNYSAGLIDLVKDMLRVNPNDRPSACEAETKFKQLQTWDPDDPSLSSFVDDASEPDLLEGNAAATATSDVSDFHPDGSTFKAEQIADSILLNQKRMKHQTDSDDDETVKNVKLRPAAQIRTPEGDLKHFGYRFDETGCLVNIKTYERFQYEFYPKREDNEERYQTIAQVVTDYVCVLLERHLKMYRVHLPLDYKDGEPWTYVYVTADIFTNPDKILILIGGSDPVRAGIWSRKAIINDSIDAGSQIPCIKEAMSEGYAVLLLNQNQTYYEVDGYRCKIRDNEDPMKHTLYVWDKIIMANTKAKNIAFFTHTCGGQILTRLAIERADQFCKLVFGMALCQSHHEDILKNASKPVVELFSRVSKNWIANKKPLNELLKRKSYNPFSTEKDRTTLSAGDIRPEWTTHSCKDSAFKFLRELYSERNNKSSH